MTDSESKVLEPDCDEAWDAYNAMFKSKTAHFEFMEVLENKKRNFNLNPTEDDKQKLADLLALHDAEVKRFTGASIELKKSNPSAHKALFEYIAEIAHNASEENVKH